jgi:hypothetical protein
MQAIRLKSWVSIHKSYNYCTQNRKSKCIDICGRIAAIKLVVRNAESLKIMGWIFWAESWQKTFHVDVSCKCKCLSKSFVQNGISFQSNQGSMLWSLFPANFANFRRKNLAFSLKSIVHT